MKNDISSIAQQLLKKEEDIKAKELVIYREKERIKRERLEAQMKKDGEDSVEVLRGFLSEDASDQDIIDFMSISRPSCGKIERVEFSCKWCFEEGTYTSQYKEYVKTMANKGVEVARCVHVEQEDISMHRCGGYKGTTFTYTIKL